MITQFYPKQFIFILRLIYHNSQLKIILHLFLIHLLFQHIFYNFILLLIFHHYIYNYSIFKYIFKTLYLFLQQFNHDNLILILVMFTFHNSTKE